MKAERRHQLQANELARQLETFPETLKRHASKIILAVTALVVIIFVVRYRQQAEQVRLAGLSNALSVIRRYPNELRALDLMRMPELRVATERTQLIGETTSAIETVLRDADGPYADAMRAEAWVARGDLNWAIANLRPLAGAATQPALKLPRSGDDYLRAAEEAYGTVARHHEAQVVPWVTAQFGLAAIAENRREWDKAREIYTAVLNNTRVPQVFKTQATLRLNTLDQIRNPSLIGPFGAAATQATTQPATQAVTAPATQPLP